MVQNKNAKAIDRRQFIKTSTAAGASLILAPHVLTGAKSFGVDDINVALLGAGAQGQVLMNACLKIPGIRFKPYAISGKNITRSVFIVCWGNMVIS